MIIIRPSEEKDAEFLAKIVAVAAGITTMEKINDPDIDPTLEVMKEVCASEWGLYSWKHSITAEDTVTKKAVGCIVSYDGAIYAQGRMRSFDYIKKRLGTNISQSDAETGPGEYYLDSMAILPEYRGNGLGLKLIRAAVEKAQSEGHTLVTLIADSHAPSLRGYYSLEGFTEGEELMFFGHPYIKMYKTVM